MLRPHVDSEEIALTDRFFLRPNVNLHTQLRFCWFIRIMPWSNLNRSARLFAICKYEAVVRLGEKLQNLRAVEGQLRGLNRPLSLTEVVRSMREELGEALSLPYLSQIERGARPHLTTHTRHLLARFFNVHPGYLVDDPEGYQEGLRSLTEPATSDLGEWLALRAEELRDDPELYEAILQLASATDPRAELIALGSALSEEATRELVGSAGGDRRANRDGVRDDG
jgi:transcriptional regulator with XRE-family HTH domain